MYTFEQLPTAIFEIVNRLTAIEKRLCAEPTPTKVVNDKLLTTEELAEYLKVPKSFIYGKVHRNQLPAKRMPGSRKLYFDVNDVENLLKH